MKAAISSYLTIYYDYYDVTVIEWSFGCCEGEKEVEDRCCSYKVEVLFEDVLKTANSHSDDRCHISKENINCIWVRTTNFSGLKSIGQSTSFF